jgi:lipopolysaccharide export system permease protein
MMKKIDRYILKKFLSTFVFVVLILVSIIVVIDHTEKYDDFISNDVPRKLVIRYYLTFIPYMASLLTPITVFIATVFVTARLAANTEVIAILASGVSFRRMMYPYFIGAILIAAASFYLNSYVIPDANKFRISFELDYLKKPFYFSGRNIHIRVGPTDYVYMDRYNNQRDVGYKVSLEKIEDGVLKEKLNASRIQWDSANQKWKIFTWQLRKIDSIGETYEVGMEIDTTLLLSPADFDNKERLWETLTLRELNDYIDLQLSRGSEDVQVYKIEKYIRFMQPFTVLILTFIGLIVSARKNRRGTGFQIALGFFIAFIFILFFILSRAIAEANTMNAVLAVWLPNIIFTLVGLVMYHTVPR